MAQYKKFFIQQQTFDGSSYTDVGDVVDANALWNIACQEIPFKHLPDVKDYPKRDWNDESGVDVFIPSDGLKFKEYDLDASFLYVGTEQNISDDLKKFIDFIYGRINGVVVPAGTSVKNVMLKVYDEYTKTGRRGVVTQQLDNEIFFYNDVSVDALAGFKAKFLVTDPVYSVVHSVSNNKDVLT